MRTTILACILLAASCSDELPASRMSPDDAAATDALARGEAIENPVDAGAELSPAETSPASSGGAGGARDGGSGGAGGSGGTSTGGSDGGAGGAGGAPSACAVPTGAHIESKYCDALSPTGGTRALMKQGRYCLKNCTAVLYGNLPAGTFGMPECVTPNGGLCVRDCSTCQ